MREVLRIAEAKEPELPPKNGVRPMQLIVERTPKDGYWIEKLSCGHTRIAFACENATSKHRVCKKCCPQPIRPKPQGVKGDPVPSDPVSERLVEKLKADAEIQRHNIVPPIDWPW